MTINKLQLAKIPADQPFHHSFLLGIINNVKRTLDSPNTPALLTPDGQALYAYAALSLTEDFRSYIINLIIFDEPPLQLFRYVNKIPKLNKERNTKAKIRCSIACFTNLLAQSKAASEMHVLAEPHACTSISADLSNPITKQNALEILNYLNDEPISDESGAGNEINSGEKAADKKAYTPYIFERTKKIPSNRVNTKSNTIVVGELANYTPTLSTLNFQAPTIERLGSTSMYFNPCLNELPLPEYLTLLKELNTLQEKHSASINACPSFFYYAGLREHSEIDDFFYISLFKSTKTPTLLFIESQEASTTCTFDRDIIYYANRLIEAGNMLAKTLMPTTGICLPITKTTEVLELLNKPPKHLSHVMSCLKTVETTYKFVPFIPIASDATHLTLNKTILKIPFYEFSIKSQVQHTLLFMILNQLKMHVQKPIVQCYSQDKNPPYYYYVALSQETHKTLHFNLMLSHETPEEMLSHLHRNKQNQSHQLTPEVQSILCCATLLLQIIKAAPQNTPKPLNEEDIQAETIESINDSKAEELTTTQCDDNYEMDTNIDLTDWEDSNEALLAILETLNKPSSLFELSNDRTNYLMPSDISMPIPSDIDLFNKQFIVKIKDFDLHHNIKKLNYHSLLQALYSMREETSINVNVNGAPLFSPNHALYYYPFLSKKDNETLLIGQMISHTSPAELLPMVKGKKLASLPINLQSILIFASIFIQTRLALLREDQAFQAQKNLHHTQEELKAALDLLNDISQACIYSMDNVIYALRKLNQKPTISLELIEDLIPHLPPTKYQTFFESGNASI